MWRRCERQVADPPLADCDTSASGPSGTLPAAAQCMPAGRMRAHTIPASHCPLLCPAAHAPLSALQEQPSRTQPPSELPPADVTSPAPVPMEGIEAACGASGLPGAAGRATAAPLGAFELGAVEATAAAALEEMEVEAARKRLPPVGGTVGSAPPRGAGLAPLDARARGPCCRPAAGCRRRGVPSSSPGPSRPYTHAPCP